MSEGPIRAWRDSWKPPKVSTADNKRKCRSWHGKGYCGRSAAPLAETWEETNCADCEAAYRADGGTI